MSAPSVLGLARLWFRGEEPGLQGSACSGRARQEEEGQGEGAGGCEPPLVLGWAWAGSVSTSGFHSRDGQEVAVVYYREGYVPQVYDQQVSTHLPAPETTSWPLPRELQIIPGAATLAGVGSVLPGVTESIGKL